MNKEKRKKGFWFYFGRVMAGLGIALLLAVLAIYLTVPTYSFRAPQPFEGEFMYNPYQDMNPDQWKKYHFHCHSRKYFGLTNGRKSAEVTIDSVYQALGYDHYGISDYMSINPYGSDKDGYIPAYEHGYGLIRKTHQICIGAKSVYRIDFPFVQSINMKQHMINKLGESCRFVMPAHASFTTGYKVNDMVLLSNYRLLEVLNPYGNAFEHWDKALSNGHRVYALGDDDTHDITNHHEVCHNLTMINTPDLDPEHVYDALDKGLCYAVEFDNWFHYPMPLSEKIEQAQALPHLTYAQLVNDTLFIKTSLPTMQEVQFIGQDGKVLKTEENVETAWYAIQPEDHYVRTHINVNGLQHFYLNPVTRHTTPEPVDQRLDFVNKAQTYLYWFVYIAAIAALIWHLFKKAKEKKEEKK